MKTLLRFAFGIIFMLLLSQNVYTQDTVTVSTVGDTTWFSLESACTVPQTLGGAYTGPADLTGFVLYDGETGDNRIYARPAENTDDELWALVPSGDVVFLQNKLTGRFMNQSHSLGDTGEAVLITAARIPIQPIT